MKKHLIICCSFVLLVIASCSQHKDTADDGSYMPPVAGTIVAADSMKVTGEPNHFTFSVTVKTNDNTKYGVYDVQATCGPDTADGQFTMPHGGERQKPLIRKGDMPNSYIIGFHYGADTSFYNYYEVKNERNGLTQYISMKYLKAYSFK